MRIAVCASDMERRHKLSVLLETALLRKGELAEVTLFPETGEMAEAAQSGAGDAFALALIEGARDENSLRALCERTPVILVGDRDESFAAFDVGAKYFIDAPICAERLDRAIARCLGKKEMAI